MKKVLITATIIAAMVTTGVYANESTKLNDEEYRNYTYDMIEESNSLDVEDISFENICKYGLDKGGVEPVKNLMITLKEFYLPKIEELNSFRFKSDEVKKDRDNLVLSLNEMMYSIDTIIGICDQVIEEESTFKAVSILLFDGVEAWDIFYNQHCTLNSLFE